jgi:hypothetical protein
MDKGSAEYVFLANGTDYSVIDGGRRDRHALVIHDHSNEELPYYDGFDLVTLLAHVPEAGWKQARIDVPFRVATELEMP